MDKMTLLSILTVSLPEAILNIYVAFVLTGQRNRLYLDDKLNILRLLIAVPLVVIAAVISRWFLSSFALIPLVNILVYIPILKIVYKQKWREAILCVVIFMGLLAAIESLYILPLMTFLEDGFSNYYSNDIIRILSSLPERLIQIVIIISFWKWDLVYINLRNNKKAFRSFILLAIILLAVEAGLTFAFFHNLTAFSLIYKIVFSSGLCLLGTCNFLLCKAVILLAKNTN